MRTVFSLLLASCFVSLGVGQPSMNGLLDLPFASELRASTDGRTIAWVRNVAGVRNIWLAVAPGWEPRQITNYTADDGQELTRLLIGSSEIVFQYGGSPNQSGDIPNPTSDPGGARREIWAVPVTGGAPRPLSEGSRAILQQDEQRVLFVKGGNLWVVELEPESEPELLVSMRGGPTSLRLSPNGRQLAFVSNRGDHSFIGLYDFASEKLRFLDPGLDQDREPVWSPDGRQIAFLRIPHERLSLPYMPRRSGLPWSIRVVEPESNRGRTLWTAPEGPGSAFRGVVADQQIHWTSDNNLVFPWEGDGWQHLYSIPASGGQVRLLTPGDFEVEYVAPSQDGVSMVFSSNQGDMDRRDLWQVRASDSRPAQLTRSRAIEWGPVSVQGGTAFVAAELNHPAHVKVLLPGAEPRALIAPSGSDNSSWLVEPQPVEFQATDGMTIRGQLFLPRDTSTPRPALIFLHGGSRRQMLLGWHDRQYYHNAFAFNQYMASQGYVVLSVNYRSGTGYGLEFREALHYGARGASEFQDVLGAGLFLASRPDVDREKIGLWGGSYGGYLTALGLSRASHLFAAGVDLHGVHDWRIEFEWDRRLLPDSLEEREQALRLAYESSPMSTVDTWRSPVLFIHGDDDRNVPFRETVDLAERLRHQGVEFEFLVFPDEVHGFLRTESWRRAYAAAEDFFNRKLK